MSLQDRMLKLLAEGVEFAERDPDEVEFIRQVMEKVRPLKGQRFQTEDGAASLSIERVGKAVTDPASEAFEFVIPIVVVYAGKVAGDQWAKVEKKIEGDILSAIQAVGEEIMEEPPSVTLVRRRKTDPFKSDPKSLTQLRFRVE